MEGEACRRRLQPVACRDSGSCIMMRPRRLSAPATGWSRRLQRSVAQTIAIKPAPMMSIQI